MASWWNQIGRKINSIRTPAENKKIRQAEIEKMRKNINPVPPANKMLKK
jgi:hypothetical protein